MPRPDGRRPDELRPFRFTRGFTDVAPGSVLVEAGRTRVLCTASVDERVPDWMRGRGGGWVTAEYAMLPSSTSPRKRRESAGSRPDGRGMEISRLIGRSLRAVVNLGGLGERTVYVDCEVLVADGGTRTAAISGGWVALADACRWLVAQQRLKSSPLSTEVAAVSVGMVDGEPVLDLPYEEDARAEVDMNVVVTGEGRLVEVQGAAEGRTFSRADLDALLDLAFAGAARIRDLQRGTLASCPRSSETDRAGLARP